MKTTLILAITSILFFSCRKDEYTNLPIQQTPYILNIPSNLEQNLSSMEIPSDNPMTVEGVDLGRKLFYEVKLSGDHSQSCASCHSLGNSFSDTVSFSVGIDGVQGTRKAMPIINIGWMSSLFWDGRAKSIEEQAFGPVVNPVEIHNTWAQAVADLQADSEYPNLFKKAFGTYIIDSVLVVKALAQFERTLISGNSPFDKYLRGEPTGWSEVDMSEAYQGYILFMNDKKGNCFSCHGDEFNPLWTDNEFHNNGLDAVFTDKGLGDVTGDLNDDGKFKTPTLRNLVYTSPYMHDGRFETLDQVIVHYSYGLQNSTTIDPLMTKVGIGGIQLSITERALLKKFLLSLSDDEFIVNPDFKKP